MVAIFEGNLNAKDIRFALVASRFNDFIGEKLIDGALDALIRHGAKEEDIGIFKVPGSFEIPLTAKKLVKTGNFDAVICLGVIIRGATSHFEYISAEVSKGIALTSLETETPISFGILTTDNIEQAIERAGSKAGNKGWNAAVSAIEMVNLIRKI